MRIILSSRHPRNSTYYTEAGRLLYKVNKPHKIKSSIATIRRAVHTVSDDRGTLDSKTTGESHFSDSDEMAEEKHELEKSGERRSVDSKDAPFADTDSENATLLGSDVNDLPVRDDNFTFRAQVEFHTFSSTRFRYNDLDIPVSKFFRKQGWSWYGRGRVFRASDGQDYRWNLCFGHVEMIKNDGTKKQVVKFHEYQPSLGPLMKGRPAALEVDNNYLSILDEIIMTFIYCHKLRKDRERDQRKSAMGGGESGGG